jgi:lipoate-protein ligase A
MGREERWTCRLLWDPPASGAWNMAVDEVLLERAAEGDCDTFRVYGWSEPTLSLGYFQSLADRSQHQASENCPAVRRLSGGGAILHDREWTYSLALSRANRWSRAAPELYAAVHEAAIAALETQHVEAKLCGPARDVATEAPFLCFQRRAEGDVLLDGAKVLGSAQRRRQGAVLQHGSLLRRSSRAATELPGLDDLAGRPATGDSFVTAWLTLLERRLGSSWAPDRLTKLERVMAVRLEREKYSGAAWNSRK